MCDGAPQVGLQLQAAALQPQTAAGLPYQRPCRVGAGMLRRVAVHMAADCRVLFMMSTA